MTRYPTAMPGHVEVLEEGPQRIRVRVRFPDRTAAEVYRDWVDPTRVAAWWGPAATIDLRVGGSFEFRWPKIDAVLRGKYLRIEPGVRLDFTWTWDADPERQHTVALTFHDEHPSGSSLEVTQGPYSRDRRDEELRHQHLDGWKIHLPRLGGPI
jgi:uncharacterized protein YndB with AHSA1/START domain